MAVGVEAPGKFAPGFIDAGGGGGAVSGTLAATEAPDTASITGSVDVSGSLAATEAPDTASITAAISSSGSLAATEAPDTASITGAVGVAGTLAATESPDTASIAGSIETAGTLAATEAPDKAAINGSVQIDITGVLAASEAPDTASIIADNGVTAEADTHDAPMGPNEYKFWKRQQELSRKRREPKQPESEKPVISVSEPDAPLVIKSEPVRATKPKIDLKPVGRSLETIGDLLQTAQKAAVQAAQHEAREAAERAFVEAAIAQAEEARRRAEDDDDAITLLMLA